jgi:hypothetical protein
MIPRVSPEVFSQRGGMAQGSPVIIVNALEEWDLKNRWTPERLALKLKKRRIPVSVSSGRKFGYKETPDPHAMLDFSLEAMDFATAVRRISQTREDECVYMMQQSVARRLPELMSSFIVPAWIRSEQGVEVNFWFGRDAITPLHFDSSNNLFAQVHGRKTFVIFAPRDTDYLYPYDVRTATPHVSHVDANQPDLARYPEFPQAAPIRFVLNEGELLFLPAFWWHQVQSLGVAISVSFWWPPRGPQLLVSPNASRVLYQSYGSDRLVQVRNRWLQPSDLDFLTTARLLLKAGGNPWTAAVLALAAFDELASTLVRAMDLTRPRGCALVDLEEDIRPICKAISGGNALPEEVRAIVANVPSFARRVACFSESEINTKEVEALMGATDALHHP